MPRRSQTREGLEEGTASAKPWDGGELRHFKKQKSQCGKRPLNKVRDSTESHWYKTIAPYTGIALRAGPKVTDQVQLGHHHPQLWAREPQMGRASSGPNVSQPAKDLRGQEGLSLDDDSTPPR